MVYKGSSSLKNHKHPNFKCIGSFEGGLPGNSAEETEEAEHEEEEATTGKEFTSLWGSSESQGGHLPHSQALHLCVVDVKALLSPVALPAGTLLQHPRTVPYRSKMLVISRKDPCTSEDSGWLSQLGSGCQSPLGWYLSEEEVICVSERWIAVTRVDTPVFILLRFLVGLTETPRTFGMPPPSHSPPSMPPPPGPPQEDEVFLAVFICSLFL